MSEQLALEKGLGDGGAVDGHERTVAPGTAPMNRERGHFLACSALAKKQNGGVGCGYLANGCEDILHLAAGTQHAFEAVVVKMGLHVAIVAFQFCNVKGANQDHAERVHVDGLVEEVVGPAPDGLQRVLFFALPGDDDDLRVRRDGQDFAQRLESLFRAVGVGREAEVEEDDIRLGFAHALNGLLPGRSQQDFIGLRKTPFHLFADVLVVVNHQKNGFHINLLARGTGHGTWFPRLPGFPLQYARRGHPRSSGNETSRCPCLVSWSF